MSQPYRESPEVIERIVEKIVMQIPKCSYARCPSCQSDLDKITALIAHERKCQCEYHNVLSDEGSKSHARSAEKYVELYIQLLLRKCEHE